MSIPTILVAGTHGLRDFEALDKAPWAALPWWHPRSAFGLAAPAAGVSLIDPVEPFIWSTELDGVAGANLTWYGGAAALRYFAHWKHPPVEGRERPVSVICHSHGSAVAIFAAAQGLLIDVLVTVAAPVRRDMLRFRRGARPNVRRWVHLYSPTDPAQRAGAIGDGDWPWNRRRDMPEADVNVPEPGLSPLTGHSDLLDVARWTKRSWWAFVRPTDQEED